MPLLNIYTSAAAPAPEKAAALLKTLSQTLARELNKPESYVMTCLVPQTRMTFAASEAPACYAEIKNIGELSHNTTERLSATLCRTLADELGVAKNRIYIEFSSPAPHLFGFDGKTFA